MAKQNHISVVSIKDLLQAGAHFGHQRQRWNPKMRRFIFEERGGIYIIDLAKTVKQVAKAVEVVEEVVKNHQRILFVGTKKQAKEVIRESAEASGEFYVVERWLGGMLTNLATIRQSIKTLERIEKRLAAGEGGVTKKENTLLAKDRNKLDRILSGIRGMRKLPGLLIVVDPSKEHIAVAEANKLGIPVLALVDTNCDPDPIDYVIACNDDALKSIKLIIRALVDRIIEVKAELKVNAQEEDAKEKEDLIEQSESQVDKGEEDQ